MRNAAPGAERLRLNLDENQTLFGRGTILVPAESVRNLCMGTFISL